MKTIKSIALSILLLGTTYISFAQTAQGNETKALIDSKHFIFEVQSTSPQRGITKQESYGFFLRISGDTLYSYLPFYGRATTPIMNPGERPLNFTSVEFLYEVKERKKGGWDISIKPTDQKNVREI